MQSTRSYHPAKFASGSALTFTVYPSVATAFDTMSIRLDVTAKPAVARENDDSRVLSLRSRELSQVVHAVTVGKISNDEVWKWTDPDRIPSCLKAGPLTFDLMETSTTDVDTIAVASTDTYVNLVLTYENSSSAFRKMMDSPRKRKMPISYIN